MKIALFTIWHEKNFGAEMQAYATLRALKELGHDVFLVDLRLDDIRDISLKGKIASLIENISPNYRNFKKFWNKNFPKAVRYRSWDDLKKNPCHADMYLVGSDQTWNPHIMRSLLPAALLDFGSKQIIRASYAASFGVNSWSFPEKLTIEVKHALSNFNYISCREKTGCEILKQVFGVDSVNVLDPTLLHSNYNELVGELEESPILTYYPLSKEDNTLEIYAQIIAKELNLSVVNANEYHCIFGKIVWKRTHIQNWISSIGGAKFVLTRSFHGLSFSLIYRRQFAVVINNEKSCRVADLLNELGLQNRLFPDFESLVRSRIWEETIDYDQVMPKLERLRKQSWNYLMNFAI